MKPAEKSFKTIWITPEEFYNNVPKSIVPKKALKGDFDFYFVPELNIYFIYNRSREEHFVLK